MHRAAILLFAIALAGCATSFYGSAKVDNGPAGCKSACDAWGMELAGMVKMGEYSDGCICQVKSSSNAPSGRSGASIPAVTGVYLQMQAAAAAAAAQQQQQEMERQQSRRGPSPAR